MENEVICKTAIYWKNYSFSAWVKKGNDGNPWLTYEIQRSIFLGKDKPKKEQWSNQALSLTKIEDLCYLKTLNLYIFPKNNDKQLQKNCYVGKKNFNENEVKKWKDINKPSKEEIKNALRYGTIEYFRKYTDKDGKDGETNHLVINNSELDIFRDFIIYCISQIYNIKRVWEKNVIKEVFGSKYNDNIDYSQKNEEEFIDEKLDDDIPF